MQAETGDRQRSAADKDASLQEQRASHRDLTTQIDGQSRAMHQLQGEHTALQSEHRSLQARLQETITRAKESAGESLALNSQVSAVETQLRAEKARSESSMQAI